ncbi:hypothetical protein Pcinc_031706 [Petrolisthes cinctipes]|uniref:Uncharacterized protein n=1 Tax=Petrolisthes cinctipes TaxID=88211 RepID=A0AAE1EVL1_PETCI|nr:hypothetical protein Pcinc_031706 [Petrolisthes cinctipes]
MHAITIRNVAFLPPCSRKFVVAVLVRERRPSRRSAMIQFHLPAPGPSSVRTTPIPCNPTTPHLTLAIPQHPTHPLQSHTLPTNPCNPTPSHPTLVIPHLPTLSHPCNTTPPHPIPPKLDTSATVPTPSKAFDSTHTLPGFSPIQPFPPTTPHPTLQSRSSPPCLARPLSAHLPPPCLNPPLLPVRTHPKHISTHSTYTHHALTKLLPVPTRTISQPTHPPVRIPTRPQPTPSHLP